MLYDPRSGNWSPPGALAHARSQPTATVLSDGRVLLTGGDGAQRAHAHKTAEVFDPATGSWSTTGAMADERLQHTATLLADGRVLVTGGTAFSPTNQRAEIYEP